MRVRELAGWGGTVLIAIATVAQTASSARAELLFRDGDSVVVAMLVRSLVEGERFDWIMSSVLFLPEAVVFGVIWALGRLVSAEIDAVIVANAVVNLVALYGALRFSAGRRRADRAPVAWSLIGLAAFCLVTVTETSASRDALELASLLSTTTYYSATVIAAVLSVGVIRRAFDRVEVGRMLPLSLGLIAAISTLSNPLYAAWATVPLGAILAVAAVYPASRRPALVLLGWLIGGTAAGLICRIPLSAWIANSGAGYVDPERWPESLRYYGELLADRVTSPLGVLGTAVVVALLVFAVHLALRARDIGSRVVATSAFALPLLVAIGAVALGTHAARYLEPVVFAPMLALVASPSALRMPPRAVISSTAAVASVLVIGGALSIPRVIATTTRPNADLACVTDWVDASGRTGAGQFWTVRLPKLHLDDPSQLVQVDHQLNAYAWLVNRADFTAGEVTFLVEDAQSTAWALGANAIPTEIIGCGQYTIYDFSLTPLPLGPPRS